jgi:REP element-mobilizing transposase RayT
MPVRNAIKSYVEQGIYHVYNRGLNKQLIFLDNRDYTRFKAIAGKLLYAQTTLRPGRAKNFSEEITILNYCLMPNHFHVLVQQRYSDSMTRFMRSLTNQYVHYFNFRHQRTGSLFSGRYKARLISNDEDLVNVRRYIIENPLEIVGSFEALTGYPHVGTDLRGQSLED